MARPRRNPKQDLRNIGQNRVASMRGNNRTQNTFRGGVGTGDLSNYNIPARRGDATVPTGGKRPAVNPERAIQQELPQGVQGQQIDPGTAHCPAGQSPRKIPAMGGSPARTICVPSQERHIPNIRRPGDRKTY